VRDYLTADDVMRAALRDASAGLDLDVLGQATQDAVEALARQAAAAKALDYEGMEAGALAKAMNNLGKMVDTLARLHAFAKGQPDSRPDFGREWLQALSKEQIEEVSRWLEAKGQ
jgi:hypothetical protein